MRTLKLCWVIITAATMLMGAGCKRNTSGGGGDSQGKQKVRITGSDTMVNLAQAWSEKFQKNNPDISVPVKGGGSGVGINSLIDGKIEIATSSRKMEPKEIQRRQKNSGKEPIEFQVGLDALAIYANPQNPVESLSIEELAEIFGENGKINTWKDLGVENTACPDGEIIRITRQNSSGTYAYFKEAVLGKTRDYKEGASQQSGSSDVVNLISHTPCALGYSGMGYKNDSVKFVKVSKKKGDPAIVPSVEAALDGSYPISRPLFLYTLGEPTGATKKFINWVRSDEGQDVVEKLGYVPLPKDQRVNP